MRDDPIGNRKVELLIRYLSFPEINGGSDVSAPSLSGQAWSDVVAAALSSQLYPALVHTLGQRDKAIFDGPELDRRRAPPVANFHYRSSSQRRHLLAAVRGLNAAGIEPCLAGGARELWLEAPNWRFVSEIELLVEPASFKSAEAAMERCGWQQVRALVVSGYHTERWLVHRDTTGHIALRATGTNRSIERVFPSSICTRGGLTVAVDCGMSRLATPAAYCLYAVVSHHFAPASRRGKVAAIKPLYELAARLIEMKPRDRSELRDMIAKNSELSAIFGIWHAAACRTFGLPPVPPLDHPVGTGQSVELVDLAGQFHVALR
jgi:hypothetical protein